MSDGSGWCNACFDGDHGDCDDTCGYDDIPRLCWVPRLCWCPCRDDFWGQP